jgi:competence protein ComFC
MAEINPISLAGPWREGYSLDRHTVSSVYLGLDEFGHDRFETKRSEIGELLFRFKYRNDGAMLPDLVQAAVGFIQDGWRLSAKVNGIIAVPPSSTTRRQQPVQQLARGIGRELGLPVLEGAVRKVKATPQLKDFSDYQQRVNVLADAFVVDSSLTKGLALLVVDDLFQSGATLSALSRVLLGPGQAAEVYVLTLTKTRG